MKIVDIFFDVHMSNAHDGLAKIMGRGELKEGQYAVFINKSWTALKMLTPGNIILHLRQPSHRPIDPGSIKYLPLCVNGGKLNYNRALSQSIKDRFARRKT